MNKIILSLFLIFALPQEYVNAAQCYDAAITQQTVETISTYRLGHLSGEKPTNRQQAIIDFLANQLMHNADPNARIDAIKEGTIFTFIATLGNPTLLNLALKKGAFINTLNERGSSSLMVVCAAGNTACVETLLKAGANKTLTLRGRTALEMAESTHQYTAIAQLFINYKLPKA